MSPKPPRVPSVGAPRDAPPRAASALFPYFLVRASLVSLGLALVLLLDARGTLRLVGWALIAAPLAGELLGSVLYLRRRASDGRHSTGPRAR